MKEMKLNVVYLSWSQDGTPHPWGYGVVMDVLGTGLRYLCNNKGKKMLQRVLQIDSLRKRL
jgi:hypothetical protein